VSRYYRRNQVDQLAEEMLMTGLAVAGLVAVGIGVLIARLLHTPVEDKLRRLKPKEEWGEWIGSAACPHCRSRNQLMTGYCPRCGRSVV
jgi:hypothetical protein